METAIAGARAVAFDLDDTLTDWHTGIARAAQAVGDPPILDRVVASTWVRRDGVIVNRHHWRRRIRSSSPMWPQIRPTSRWW